MVYDLVRVGRTAASGNDWCSIAAHQASSLELDCQTVGVKMRGYTSLESALTAADAVDGLKNWPFPTRVVPSAR
jgi:hypothetical protein